MPDPSHFALFLGEWSLPDGFSFLEGELNGWPYLITCVVLFVTLGIVTGYFIWKKGYLQTIDAETEIRKTVEELARVREDVKLETLELVPAESPSPALATGDAQTPRVQSPR